jgi:hypothetical protein
MSPKNFWTPEVLYFQFFYSINHLPIKKRRESLFRVLIHSIPALLSVLSAELPKGGKRISKCGWQQEDLLFLIRGSVELWAMKGLSQGGFHIPNSSAIIFKDPRH